MAAMGFSHVGVSTHDMDATIGFYEGLLGYKRVVDERTSVREGGMLRQVYFDLGAGQFIVFMEAKNISSFPKDYDTSINGALGTPSGMYHFAFKIGTLAALEEARARLAEAGTSVSDIIDLEAAKSIFLSDPNGLQIELCWHFREFNEVDLDRRTEVSLAIES